MLLHRPSAAAAPPRRKRRGATALEYLFCMSLILVVCIAGVKHVSGMLKKSYARSSEKLEATNK